MGEGLKFLYVLTRMSAVIFIFVFIYLRIFKEDRREMLLFVSVPPDENERGHRLRDSPVFPFLVDDYGSVLPTLV